MEPLEPIAQFTPQETAHHEFSWEILRFMLEGRSPIDIPSLDMRNREEAHQFITRYGYNLDNPQERDILRAVFAEAVEFIKRYFCLPSETHPETYTVPSEIERVHDVRDLLVWASSYANAERQAWSCAVLRVMHTIIHIDNAMRIESFPEIKRQILDRFKQNIHEDEAGQPVLGTGTLAVPLYGVFYKEEKSRDSLILKLLHKEKNVAENIHDRLGVKLVTHNRFDALRALRCLRQNLIIMFTNLTPGRSRNLLINLQSYRELYDKCTEGMSATCGEEEREQRFIDLLADPAVAEALDRSERAGSAPAGSGSDSACSSSNVAGGATGAGGAAGAGDAAASANNGAGGATSGAGKRVNAANAFSSPDYQSIQFTVQQPVTLENPGYFKARRMRVQLEKYHLGPDMEGLLRELEGPDADREMRVLFPLEVQIIDKVNYDKSIEGSASHEEYKKRQIKAACDRVMFAVHSLVRKRFM